MAFAKRAILAMMMVGIAATCADATVQRPEHQQLVFKSPGVPPVRAVMEPMSWLNFGCRLQQNITNCGAGYAPCAPTCMPVGASCCNENNGLFCPAFAPKCGPPGSSSCNGVGAAIQAHMGAVVSSLLLFLLVMVIV